MASDNKYFNCSEEHEFKYVSGLYSDSNTVHDFLKKSCKNGKINYSSHQEVYQLIEDKLSLTKKENMLDVSFELNGKKVNPNKFGNTLESAVLNKGYHELFR